LDRGEMSFGLFDYSSNIEAICLGNSSTVDKLDALAKAVDVSSSIFVHQPADISGYTDAVGLDKERISRVKKFYGKSQEKQAPESAVHRLIIFHNGGKKARLFYKFIGSIEFIKNTSHDS
jgi:hypothetical protein